MVTMDTTSKNRESNEKGKTPASRRPLCADGSVITMPDELSIPQPLAGESHYVLPAAPSVCGPLPASLTHPSLPFQTFHNPQNYPLPSSWPLPQQTPPAHYASSTNEPYTNNPSSFEHGFAGISPPYIGPCWDPARHTTRCCECWATHSQGLTGGILPQTFQASYHSPPSAPLGYGAHSHPYPSPFVSGSISGPSTFPSNPAATAGSKELGVSQAMEPPCLDSLTLGTGNYTQDHYTSPFQTMTTSTSASIESCTNKTASFISRIVLTQLW